MEEYSVIVPLFENLNQVGMEITMKVDVMKAYKASEVAVLAERVLEKMNDIEKIINLNELESGWVDEWCGLSIELESLKERRG